MNKKQKGNLAELLVRLWLRLKGYRIIEKNYITGRGTTAGELDIVCTRNKTLIFVEVKERKILENALYAISSKQQKRIINAAKLYLSRHKQYEGFDIRFDAVFIGSWKIRHIKNAFC